MNTILVLIDSLNRHALSAYAPSPIMTPNLERLAARAWRFDNHFVGSLPCMPARRELYAGRREMMWRPWGPLEPFDLRLPELLAAQGHTTALVTDHYHYWEEEANGYLQSFGSTELIRGHENDFWKPPVKGDVPEWVENIEVYRPGKGRGYYGNVKDFKAETDYFPAKVFSGAARWLGEHARAGSFYLQVESFDVHEPFDVPEPYRSMYGDSKRCGDGGGRDRFNIWPPYQDVAQLRRFMAEATEEELDFIRAQYAGKLTMVDRWFGELLDALDRQGLWDETVLIVTTDHGHDLGQRGVFGKQWPHFDSHANIPLLVWHPDYPGEGRSTAALTSTVDLFATVLEAMGAPVPAMTHSRSFLPVLSGDAPTRREALLYGTFGQGVGCTDGTWTLLKSPERDGPLFSYSPGVFKSLTADTLKVPVAQGHFIPGVALPQWQVPVVQAPLSYENFLFNRRDDPDQTVNLWDREPGERGRMLGLLTDLLRAEGAPPEQYERLGLQVGVPS